jgi:antitoxin VapB
MQLNIKDVETHKLARSLAKETGESMTVAVKEALRERLQRVRSDRQKQRRMDALIELGRQGAKMFPGPHEDHAKLLYDENGLPK